MKKNRRHRNLGLQGLALLLSIVLLFVFMPTSALWLVESNKYSYREYRQWARQVSLPKNFVSYNDIAFLGEFVEFSISPENEDISSYGYQLETKDKLSIKIAINGSVAPYATYNTHILFGEHIYDQPNFPDMRLVDTIAIKEREGHTQFCNDIFVVSAKEVEYWYNTDGTLLFVRLYNGGVKYEFLTDFSKCEPNSWMGRLLWYETADSAAAEIKTRMAGFYQEPWEQPLTICLSAIGGAVVSTVATWLITYFVMRKRTKNSHRLGTNVENPALADGVPTIILPPTHPMTGRNFRT